MRVAPPWREPARAWALDGRVLLVQCPPIWDLIPLLSVPTIYLLLGTITDRDARLWLYQQVVAYNSRVTDDILNGAADELALSWCGLPRWFAARLWREALAEWPRFEGPLTGRGVDVTVLSPARATRLVWSTLIEWHSADKDHGEAWRRRIQAEPIPLLRRGRRAVPADVAGDAAGFLSVYGAVGGRLQ